MNKIKVKKKSLKVVDDNVTKL